VTARALFALMLFGAAYAAFARPVLLENTWVKEALYVTGIALIARHGLVAGALRGLRGQFRRPDFGDAP